MRIVDLGCGRKKADGALGVDRDEGCRPDVVHDLDRFPWPLPEGEFDRIICSHILEHLDDMDGVFREIHRIGRDRAQVEIVTPHFSSVNSWDDPTHRHHFSSVAFDRYTGFRCVERELGFGGSVLNVLPRIIARRRLRWYEKHLAFIFPARNLSIVLEVRK